MSKSSSSLHQQQDGDASSSLNIAPRLLSVDQILRRSLMIPETNINSESLIYSQTSVCFRSASNSC